eukprot:TRINITY_DN10535_c0_g1_i1.p1 TRINITY_DN10535_c0_g1~~TRINITY_DN10535_c0_g1_i1.p1  ORF type:complete len:569 (-),score=128.70 TRINITY_DN10535_c0_g1_i1:133-1815(-)
MSDEKESTITVCVRVRPMNQREVENGSDSVIQVMGDMVMFDSDPNDENRDIIVGKRKKDCKFVYDKVFDEYTSTHEVFLGATKNLVDEILKGYNCSCFAYGATGAGKTFTMIGNSRSPGVVVLTMRHLFDTIDKIDDVNFDIKVSYLEVYNENIKDLLVENSDHLQLCSSPTLGVVAKGISYHSPQSAEEVLSMLEEGNMRRSKSPTDANSESSRSHAVFTISVSQTPKGSGINSQIKSAKFTLIDLAGSERATSNKGARLREGVNINKSLLALGNCINALAKKSSGNPKAKSLHIPYRDSKLTRLLQDSLCGNCKTVMIANVSPARLSYEEIYSTLNYANRTKSIKTQVKTNVKDVQHHITKYQKIIRTLQAENAELRERLEQPSSTPSIVVDSDLQSRIKQNTEESALELEKMRKLYQKEIRLLEKINSEKDELRKVQKAVIVDSDSQRKIEKNIELLENQRNNDLQTRNIIDRKLAKKVKNNMELMNDVQLLSPTKRVHYEKDISMLNLELEKMSVLIQQERSNLKIKLLEQSLSSQVEMNKQTIEILKQINGLLFI